MTAAELEAIKARCNAATGPYALVSDSYTLVAEVEQISSYYKGLFEEHEALSVSNVALRAEVARLQALASQTLDEYRVKISASYECEAEGLRAEIEEEQAEVERLAESNRAWEKANRTLVADRYTYLDEIDALYRDLHTAVTKRDEAEHDAGQANFYLGEVEEENVALRAVLFDIYMDSTDAQVEDMAKDALGYVETQRRLGEWEKKMFGDGGY